MGFAYQVAFVRVLGRFPQQAPLEIDGEILRFAALQLRADAETIHTYAGRQQTVSEHQQRIGEYLRLRAFDNAVGERLARFLEDEALRLDRTADAQVRRCLPARTRTILPTHDDNLIAVDEDVISAYPDSKLQAPDRYVRPTRDTLEDKTASVGCTRTVAACSGTARRLSACTVWQPSREIGRHRNLDRLVGEGPELGPSPGGRSKAVLQGWPFSCRIPLLGGPHDLNRAGNRRLRASDL